MGVGHVMRCDVGCVGNETSGVGLGLSGRRDGFGTEPGTSHNSSRESQSAMNKSRSTKCTGG